MKIEFDGTDLIYASDIEVTGPDKDGFYDAKMTVAQQKIRAVSRDRFVAVAFLLQAAGEHVEGMSERAQREV